MKTDHEVRRMLNERRKGKTQEQAAARAGMSVRTARKEVETALALLLEAGTIPTHEVVRSLVLPCERPIVPQLSSGVVDLSLYDQLLIDGRRYEQPLC